MALLDSNWVYYHNDSFKPEQFVQGMYGQSAGGVNPPVQHPAASGSPSAGAASPELHVQDQTGADN